MFRVQPDHIAILVRSIDATVRSFPQTCVLHPNEEQPSEGTLEKYVTFGDRISPSVLLMQAVAEGPYLRAMKKRGPGLHHIGCVCSDIEDQIFSGAGSRLLLHPITIRTMRHDTVWFCRPGLPFLVELHQRPNVGNPSNPGTAGAILMLPKRSACPDDACRMFDNLVLENTNASSLVFSVAGLRVEIDPEVV